MGGRNSPEQGLAVNKARKNYCKLSDAQREDLVKRMWETRNATQAANEFGVSYQTANRFAYAANLPLKFSPDSAIQRHKEIVAASQAGTSPAELALRYKLDI